MIDDAQAGYFEGTGHIQRDRSKYRSKHGLLFRY